MGSFYSTCSVTGMTLTHQKVVRLLLVPSALSFKDWHNDKSPVSYDSRNAFKEKGLIVSNEGAQAIFSPFGFPIRGTYYDYGDINKIERDKNIEMLEAFFDLPIEQILEAASDDRWYKYGIERPNECLEEIKLAKADLDNFLLSYDNDDIIIKEKVKAIKELEEKHRYEIYESPKMWKLSENEPKNIDILLRLTYTDIRAEIYDFLVEQQSKSKSWWMKEVRKENNAYLQSVDEQKEGGNDLLLRFKYLANVHRSFIPSLCKDNFLTLFKIGSEWKKEYWELYYFLLALGSLRKILLPSNYGSQEDNFNLLTSLNRKANALMREDKKEHNG